MTVIPEIDDYCSGVRSGDIPTCRWLRLAVDRHYKDLKRQKSSKFAYEFHADAAQHFFDFCSDHLGHYEGVYQGKPLLLEPWQKFIYGSIFGWHRKELVHGYKVRRFRTANIIVPKKNGKSILSGAVGLYMMEADGWPGAQCYILAKNQSHAKDLGYRAATIMCEESPTLDYKVSWAPASIGIKCDRNRSFYKPITSKPDSEDGRNVHFCGPDETKDWTDFEIYEVMRNGTVNAPNSLFMSTTTAGNNRDSLGYSQQQYAEKVLSGDVSDESTFAVIFGVDHEDMYDDDGKEVEDWWLDPSLWRKANPNYGVSVFEESLQELATEARESMSKQQAFQTKHLNVWHSSVSRFIPAAKWAACGQKKGRPLMSNWKEIIHDYSGAYCWGGIDLGSVDDFSAFVLVTEDRTILPFFWIPRDTIRNRKNKDLVRRFVDEGWIHATDGDWTDHDYIEDCVKQIAETVYLQEVAYDRYKMDQMITHLLDDGIEMTPFGQGYVSMNPAVDNLENLVKKRKIEHFDNPVLSWMCSNVAVRKDPAGNRKFDKDKSQDKIDGMVALAMALYRSSVNDDEQSDWQEVKFL